jgi:two-component system NtrC family sensor kinase
MASLPLICDETLKRFEQSFAERNIEVKRQYGDAIPHLMLDPKKTSDAFISILQNAYDAMVDGGSLTVSITHDKKADTVKVIFEDRGGGIRQEHLSKVFDPFFTTKEGAIGLGLYISRLILNTMNVGILVESPGRIGTTVTCVFERVNS